MTNPQEPNYQQPDYSLLGDDHVKAYQDTDGETGFIWNGAKTLLLTTTGRKTGEARTSPLIYEADGDRFIVIASMGGAPNHPQWYRNLEDRAANPEVLCRVQGGRYWSAPVILTGDVYDRTWALLTADRAWYQTYQGKTDRRIPLVALPQTRAA